MENTYLVCFDSYKTRRKFNLEIEGNYAVNSEYAVDFMDYCCVLQSQIVELFPNFAIPISNDSFLIKTQLNCDSLLELLVKELLDKSYGMKDEARLKEQIYVAKITDFNAYTHREKQFEIEYLTDRICK